MKIPVLGLSFVSVWAGTGKVICLAWDLVSRSYITLHICAKVVKKKKKRSLESGLIHLLSLQLVTNSELD